MAPRASRPRPLPTIHGDLLTYSNGAGTWKLAYDAMNRPLTHTDPDGFESYTYYNNDGSVSKTETPYQHANGWGSTAIYDADGDTKRRQRLNKQIQRRRRYRKPPRNSTMARTVSLR